MSRTDPACFPEAQVWRLLTPEESAAREEWRKNSRRKCIKEINEFLNAQGCSVNLKSFGEIKDFYHRLRPYGPIPLKNRDICRGIMSINKKHGLYGNTRF